MRASTTAVENCGAMAAGARDDVGDMAAQVTTGNQLATTTAGADTDSSSIVNTSQCESNTAATRSIVHVLVRATVRRHTRVSYVRLDGSHDDDESEGEAASPGTAAPELLLCSEMSFVMSSSVLLPSPSHNCG